MFIKKLNKLKKLNLIFLPGFTIKVNNKFKQQKIKFINNNNSLNIFKLKEKIIRTIHNIKKKNQIFFYKILNTKNILCLINKLKSRLDYILFISNIYSSIFQSKQNIKHNFIYVNNKIITCPSFILKIKSIIKIKKLNNLYKLPNINYFYYFKKNIKNNNIFLIKYILELFNKYNNNLNLNVICFNNNKLLIQK